MREEFKNSFDHRWLQMPWGGNSILYTAEYAALAFNTPDALTKEQADMAIMSFLLTAVNELPSGESFSHDDMTAVVCLSKLYDLKYHKNVDMHKLDIIHRLHPRDIIFYLYSLGGIYKLISYPFLWIPMICMIESVFNHTYKTINGKAILATDGALLTFLRLATFKLPITKFFVKLCIRGMKWSDYFLIYFGLNHPNYILAKEVENE